MTPSNHALRVSFVCSKAWVVLQLLLFCRYCCNSNSHFATLFEICGYDCCDSSIEICLGKAAYIFGVAERVLGVGEESWILAVLDGRYVAGYVRRWEGVVGGYHPGYWRGSCCGYDNQTLAHKFGDARCRLGVCRDKLLAITKKCFEVGWKMRLAVTENGGHAVGTGDVRYVSKRRDFMSDFEWKVLQDKDNDILDNSANYIESMINNEEYDEDYREDTVDRQSWNYYNDISNEIEY